MFKSLRVLNYINTDCSPSKELADTGNFVMKTCQRVIIASFDESIVSKAPNHSHEYYLGPDAYSFLLEVICGLHSRLVCETEITAQFKDSYKEYLVSKNRDTRMIKILEKLFKDNKELRTNYLNGIGQKTYAAITRAFICSRKKIDKILIIGSGNLAIDIVNQLKKKSNIFITGRNKTIIDSIVQEHSINKLEWEDHHSCTKFNHIINTIGAEEILFNQDFFDQWIENTHHNRLFIDLGDPSPIRTTLDVEDDVIRLDLIFQEGQIRDIEKTKKISEAQRAIKILSIKREHYFSETNIG